MSYALQYDVPVNEQFYRRVKAEIGDDQPKGLVAHLVFKRDGGLRHLEVWESEPDWARFREERIEPALERVFAAAGIAGPPPRPPGEELHLVDAWLGA